MTIEVRQATIKDVEIVVKLIQSLAQSSHEHSTISAEYASFYLIYPGSCVLLAELDGRVVGSLGYSVRPDLYHANDCCMIETLVVLDEARGQGAGTALLKEVLRRGQAAGWAEVSVSTMPDNQAALALYRRMGMTDEAILLEKHF